MIYSQPGDNLKWWKHARLDTRGFHDMFGNVLSRGRGGGGRFLRLPGYEPGRVAVYETAVFKNLSEK
jgi:hypothetical protein